MDAWQVSVTVFLPDRQDLLMRERISPTKKQRGGAGETARQLRLLAALADALSSVTSTHTGQRSNHLQLQPQGMPEVGCLPTSDGIYSCTHMHLRIKKKRNTETKWDN